jgi:hypothetical protein
MAGSPPDNLFSNRAAEAALLGLILQCHGRGLAETAALTPQDFADERHRAVFVAMMNGDADFDVVVLHDRLRHDGCTNVPASFLFGLQEEAGATPRPLVEIIRDCSRRRRLDSAAHGLRQLATDSSAADIASEAKRLVDEALSGTESSTAPAGVLLSTVERETVTWLWDRRIPRGKVTILEGDPDEGKSTLALDIAARITTGRPMPFDETTREPAGVVCLSAEDGLGDTIRPRLEAAVADLSRVVGFRPDELPTIPNVDGLARIEAAIKRVGAVLVVIDPLMAFLADRIESHKDHHIRRALGPLAAFADRTGTAIVVIRHLNKSGGTHAKHRGGGSIGILGAARSALLAAPDPEDEGGARKVLAPVKHNLCVAAPALVYALVQAGDTVRVEWLGESSHTASDLLARPADEEERSALDDADEFLRTALKDGERLAKEVEREANAHGIKPRTLRRARNRAGIPSRKDGFDGPWHWGRPKEANLTEDGQRSGTGPLRPPWPPSKPANLRDHTRLAFAATDGDLAALVPAAITAPLSAPGTPADEPLRTVRPDPFAAVAPAVPCPVCRRLAWFRAGGGWSCGRCHPAPAAARS